jgi:uncharacterized protein YndB with AHSA1/START domain
MSPAPTTGGTTLHLRRTVPGPREAVFRAWTDPESLRRWFGAPDTSIPRVDLDVRVGGDYRIDMESPLGAASVFGTYIEVERPERLVYTFCWEGLPAPIAETQVTVEFHERGGVTEVVLTHERQPSRAAHEWHRWGWTHSLERFGDLLEKTAAEAREGEGGDDDAR